MSLSRPLARARFPLVVLLLLVAGCTTTNTVELRIKNTTQFPRSVTVKVNLPGDEWFDGFSFDMDGESETKKTVEGPLSGTIGVYACEPAQSLELQERISLPPVELKETVRYTVKIGR